MSTLPQLEAFPNPDEAIEDFDLDGTTADHEPADVAYIEDYRDRQRAAARLGDVALAPATLHFMEGKRVEAARNDPALLAEILGEYEWLIRVIARKYYVTGGSQDDLEQQARDGLYEAIMGYNYRRGSSFKSFAGFCIKRQVMDSVTADNRHKHRPLNHALSFSQTPAGYEDSPDFTIGDYIPTNGASVEDIVIGNEIFEGLLGVITSGLSPLERGVLSLRFEGRSYEEVAALLDTKPKAIDNALQRAWLRKIREFLEGYEAGEPVSAYTSHNDPAELEPIDGLDMPPTELSPRQYQVLKMRVGGKSNKDIREKLDMSLKAIGSVLGRAKHKIFDYLEEHDGDLDWLALIKSPVSKTLDADTEPIKGLDVPPTVFSPLEYQILMMRVDGKPNEDITEKLGITLKVIDSALGRAKSKSYKHLAQHGDGKQMLNWAALINSQRPQDIIEEPDFEAIKGLSVPPSIFTPQEYWVLRMRAEGKPNKAIMEELSVTARAIDASLRRANTKIFAYFKEHGGGDGFNWANFINSSPVRELDPNTEPIKGLDVPPTEFTYIEYWAKKLRTDGMSRPAIAEELDVKPKAIDDALKRVKIKADNWRAANGQ